MAEILIAPNTASVSTQAPRRNNESGANEAAKSDTEAGTPASFSAVLKSMSEKAPAESSKENPSVAEEQPAADGTAITVASAAATDPSALLSPMVVDSSLAANAAQKMLASTTTPAKREDDDALAVTTSAPLPAPTAVPIISPTKSAALTDPSDLLSPMVVDSSLAANAAQKMLASTASPAKREDDDALAVTASAPSPAPTAVPIISPTKIATPKGTDLGALQTQPLPIGDARDAEKNVSEQRLGHAAELASGRSTAPEMLAAKAAIAAESKKTGTASPTHDFGETDFRTVMERMANNSAANVMQTAGTSAPTTPTPALRVETPLDQVGWRDEMGQKLTWMVSNNRQQAELVLNPPQLGRIEVTLTLDGDLASASFTSPNAAVRETLENSMSRLREVLSDAGVTLGQTHVGADSRHNSSSANPKNDGLAYARKDGERYTATIDPIGSRSAVRSANGRGMVDVFA